VGELKKAVKTSKLMAIGALLLKPALKKVAADLSGDEYGGAVLLGLKAPVIIGHGATSATAVRNGTLVCAKAVRAGLVQRIEADVEAEVEEAS
jgi:glycerol-3-phosphate acyltransferase PlsX